MVRSDWDSKHLGMLQREAAVAGNKPSQGAEPVQEESQSRAGFTPQVDHQKARFRTWRNFNCIY